MIDDSSTLRRWQAVLLQAVIPILLIGVVLPIGLVALLLDLDGQPVSEAVSRGELLLAGGNAAFSAGLILIVARPDKANTVVTVVFGFVFPVVLACYVGWAHICISSAKDEAYAADLAIQWWTAIAAMLLAAALLAFAFVRPEKAGGEAAGK